MNYSDKGSAGAAGYFVYQVKDEAKQILRDLQTSSGTEWDIEEDGLIISTTLNLDLQNYASESFREHLSVMQIRLNDQYESASGNRFIGDMVGREMRKLRIEGRADEISLRQVLSEHGLVALTSGRIPMTRYSRGGSWLRPLSLSFIPSHLKKDLIPVIILIMTQLCWLNTRNGVLKILTGPMAENIHWPERQALHRIMLMPGLQHLTHLW